MIREAAQAILAAEEEGFKRGLQTARIEAQHAAIEYYDKAIQTPLDCADRDKLKIKAEAAKEVADAIGGLTPTNSA